MGNRSRRSLGTVLMAVGLLLILSVGGYFAWTEVQAAQVRSELEQGASAAAARATRVAQELAQKGAAADDPAASGGPAAVAATAKAAFTLTKQPVLPATATSHPTATAGPTSTVAAKATAAPTATDAPPPPPTATAAPLLPVRLVIPDLKIDTKVVEMGWTVKQTATGAVSEWDIPKNTAGHHLNSAGIGQGDNLVISGHNNIYARVFMPISQAWPSTGSTRVDKFTEKSDVLTGRELRLFDPAGQQHTYVITDFYRLWDTGVSQAQRIKNGRFILPTGDERVTIVTCWPPTNNTHRLVVIARPEK